MENSIVTRSGQPVSLQVFQDIYSEITGRKETFNRFFMDAHVISKQDLDRLDGMIQATLEQYHCQAKSASVVIRYIDDKTDSFSSYERFSRQGASRNQCVEEVEIQHHFLIKLPQSREARSYELTVGIRSTSSIPKKLRLVDASELETSISIDSCRRTGRMEIQYVDLSVARSLEATVEDWYSSTPRRKPISRPAKLAIRIGRHSSSILRISAISASALLLYHLLDGKINSPEDLYRAGLVTIISLAISSTIAVGIGGFLRKNFKMVIPYSKVNLTQADFDLETENENSLPGILVRSAASILGTVSLGLLTSALAAYIGI